MASKLDLTRLTQQQAAELAGVSSRALRDWTAAPRNRDGSYSGPDLVQWLIRRASSDDEYDDQRQRLAAAQAEKVEHENAIRRGEIALLSDVSRWVGRMIAAARAKFLGIPTKVAPRLVNIADANVIAAILRTELYAGLDELAEFAPEVDAEQSGSGAAPGDEDLAVAAAADGVAVGGRKPKAVERKQRRAGPVAN